MEQLEWVSLEGFRWERCENYRLQKGSIVAGDGSRQVVYRPAVDAPVVHRHFLGLASGHDDAALLAFVERHGLLGLDGSGQCPGHERLSDLWLACTHMALYAAHAHDSDELTAAKRNVIFNEMAPQHARLVLVQEHGKTVLRAQPRSLLQWMWLRLAQEKLGHIELRVCLRPDCGSEFFVGADKRVRQRKVYCSDTCRSTHRYQRARKELA